MNQDELYEASIALLEKHQSVNGAFAASPFYPTYRYCWFRDGSYIAHALLMAGRTEAAGRFHRWVAETILRRSGQIEEILATIRRNREEGRPLLTDLEESRLLHTRYHVDGEDGRDEWENHQLDGFGTWLWSLGEYLESAGQDERAGGKYGFGGGEDQDALRHAASLVSSYLVELAEEPCYDLWEEHREYRHSYTLGAIAAGLDAVEWITRAGGRDGAPTLKVSDARHGADARNHTDERDNTDERHGADARLRSVATAVGYYPKFCDVGDPGGVDASVIALAVPYNVVSLEDSYFLESVKRVEQDLLDHGGVHRYATDTFYGGGRWILLSCWLAWYYYRAGRRDDGDALLRWVESTQTPEGYLPEQENTRLIDPTMYRPWVEKWGAPATPLLWSHAMYVLAVLERGR